MQGYNVLFPMGFHYTGTPVLGMAKRIQSQEKEILDGLRNVYHVPEDAIKTFVEPIKIADYFHEEIKSGMIEMGYSIDWRREFTTIVPGYQKFIEWQITTLKENGKIIQGVIQLDGVLMIVIQYHNTIQWGMLNQRLMIKIS